MKNKSSIIIKIIENLQQMIKNNTIQEKYQIIDYEFYELRLYNRYKTIYPIMKQLIQERNKNIAPKAHQQSNKRYLRNDQKVSIYESVFTQFDPLSDNKQRQRLLRNYEEKKDLLDQKIRLQIEQCLQIQKYLHQYSNLQRKMHNLHQIYHKYSKVNCPFSISRTIDELEWILNKTLLIKENKYQCLTQIESLSILLEQLADNLKTGKDLSNVNDRIQNIGCDLIKKSVKRIISCLDTKQFQTQYFQLLAQIDSTAKKYKINQLNIEPLAIIMQIDKLIQTQNQKIAGYSQTQLLKTLIQNIAQPIYKYVFHKECQDIKTYIIDNSQDFIRKINDKNNNALKVNNQYLNLHTVVNSFLFFIDGVPHSHLSGSKFIEGKLDKVKNKIKMIQQQRDNLQQKLNELREEVQKFQKEKGSILEHKTNMQKSMSQYQKQKDKLINDNATLLQQNSILQKKLQQNLILSNETKALQTSKNDQIYELQQKNSKELYSLQQEFKSTKQSVLELQRTIDLLNITLSEKQQQIKSLIGKCEESDIKISQLQKQKRDRLFQMQGQRKTLKDEYEDKLIETERQFQKRIIQEAEKMKRQYIIEKNKEIDKIRAEKSKLAKECNQLFIQLEGFKEKYYNEIGRKLCMSYDLNSSRISDKAVGQSFQADEIEGISNVLQKAEQIPEQILSEEDIEELRNEYKKQFQEDIERLKAQITLLKQEIQQKDKELKIIAEQQEFLRKMVDKNKLTAQQMQQKLTQLQNQLDKSKQNIKLLYQINKNYQLSLNSFKNCKNQRFSNSDVLYPSLVPFSYLLFNKKLFQNRQEEKQKLIKHIQQYSEAKIIKTQFLFEYNQKNKINFHPFIDNKKYFACVVRTPKVIVAGFYPGQISDIKVMNEGGLLISVTKDKSLKLLSKKQGGKTTNYRAMTYDSYYIIFGNAELRIRTGEKVLFSNYGMSIGYFDYSQVPKKVAYFLEEGEDREVEILEYECYQLYFNRELKFNQSQLHQENIFSTA